MKKRIGIMLVVVMILTLWKPIYAAEDAMLQRFAQELDVLYYYVDNFQMKESVESMKVIQKAITILDSDMDRVFIEQTKELFEEPYYEVTSNEFASTYYMGELKDNRPDGTGVLLGYDYFSCSVYMKYMGEFKEGRFHGTGLRMIEKDDLLEEPDEYAEISTLYLGEYKDGLCNGNGLEVCYNEVNVAATYGGFVDGYANGHIKAYIDDYLAYEGEVEDGTFSGKGTSYDKNGEVIYDGEWSDGYPVDNDKSIDSVEDLDALDGFMTFNFGDDFEEPNDYESSDSAEDIYEGSENENLELESQMTSETGFPILYQAYTDSQWDPCPVMLRQTSEDGMELITGTYQEMLDSCINDGETMYVAPNLLNGNYVIPTRWDVPEEMWYEGLISYDEFVEYISWMNKCGDDEIYSNCDYDRIDNNANSLVGEWGNDESFIKIGLNLDCSETLNAFDEIGTFYLYESDEKGKVYFMGANETYRYIRCITTAGERIDLEMHCPIGGITTLGIRKEIPGTNEYELEILSHLTMY